MKKIALIACCFFCMISLTACGPKPIEKDEILNTLPSDISIVTINGEEHDLPINGFEIERQQDNDKNSIVFCKVSFGDLIYNYCKFLRLNYNYYEKGGWHLDSYEEYSPMEWSLNSFPGAIKLDAFSRAAEKFEIDAAPSDYIADIVQQTDDLGSATTTASIKISEKHANGTYCGNYLLTYQFDGKNWTVSEDQSDIEFVWDIVGTWTYSVSEPGLFQGQINRKEIIVDIEEVDASSESLVGSWKMLYYNRSTSSRERTMSGPFPYEEYTGIIFEDSEIRIITEPDEVIWDRSMVVFTPDGATGKFANYFGPVPLERENTTSTQQEGPVSNPSVSEQILAVVYDYFAKAECMDSNDVELEYYYEDDVALYGKEVAELDITDVKQYSTANAYTQAKAYKLFTEEFDMVPPGDFAEVLVHAVFNDGTSTDYRFLLAEIEDLWRIGCIDGASDSYLFKS